jgi:hypothetical protein
VIVGGWANHPAPSRSGYRGGVAEFDIVDLTVSDDAPVRAEPKGQVGQVTGQSAASTLGSVDTSVVAAGLESLRQDLAAHVQVDEAGLRLATVTVKLTVSAEGKVAFVAKGSAEASIEIVFSAPRAV